MFNFNIGVHVDHFIADLPVEMLDLLHNAGVLAIDDEDFVFDTLSYRELELARWFTDHMKDFPFDIKELYKEAVSGGNGEVALYLRSTVKYSLMPGWRGKAVEEVIDGMGWDRCTPRFMKATIEEYGLEMGSPRVGHVWWSTPSLTSARFLIEYFGLSAAYRCLVDAVCDLHKVEQEAIPQDAAIFLRRCSDGRDRSFDEKLRSKRKTLLSAYLIDQLLGE